MVARVASAASTLASASGSRGLATEGVMGALFFASKSDLEVGFEVP